MNTVEKQAYCKMIVEAIDYALAKGNTDLAQDEALAYGVWKTPTNKIASLSVLKVTQDRFVVTVRLCDPNASSHYSSINSEVHRTLRETSPKLSVSYLSGDTGLVCDYLLERID